MKHGILTELEDAIFNELYELKDFKKFFIAVKALIDGLEKEELKDLSRVVASQVFLHRFGEEATAFLVIDIESERALLPTEDNSCVTRIRRLLSEYEDEMEV